MKSRVAHPPVVGADERVWVVARDSGRAEAAWWRVGTMQQGKRVHHEKERRGRSVGGVVHKRRRSHMRLIKVPPTTIATRIRRIRRRTSTISSSLVVHPGRDREKRGGDKRE